MATPSKIKELEVIVINSNDCLETILTGLEQLEPGVQAIVDNL